MTTKQVNARLDKVTLKLLEAVVDRVRNEEEKYIQSKIMRLALLDYAIKILGEEEVQKIILETYKE